MKQTLICITIFALLSCSNQAERQKNDEQTSKEKNEVISALPNGTWFYTAYIDSTIYHKSVFKYSYTCASMAYQISFDTKKPDSIHFLGYHEQTILPITKKDDKTYWAGDDIQHWVLEFNDNYTKLTFKEYMDPTYAHKADPRTYHFNLTKNKISNISKHFVSNILKGGYKNDSIQIELTDILKGKDDFTDFYELKGINEFIKYSIAIDFWEIGPQMDLIYFYDKNGNSTYYNWTFENNDLVLRHVKEIYEDGDFADGKPTEVAYRLKRVTK